jgi:hypothetical protein
VMTATRSRISHNNSLVSVSMVVLILSYLCLGSELGCRPLISHGRAYARLRTKCPGYPCLRIH